MKGMKMGKYLIFDLDNTLYSAELGFFKLIDRRINLYMKEKLRIDEREIEKKRINYFRKYGTTLKGLQLFYDIDPDDYLEYVHDVNLQDYLKPDNRLKDLLLKISNPKVVCSNGNMNYVMRVLELLGVRECFNDIIDIKRMEYIPKPYLESYSIMLRIINSKAMDCVFIDDMKRNVRAAWQMGFITVWLNNPVIEDKAILYADQGSIEDGRSKSLFLAEDNFKPDFVINKIYDIEEVVKKI